MLTRFLLFLITFFCGSLAFSQNLDDILRYSEVSTFGTARSLGTANSMSAIGADWTALQSNPAGLGNYRINEFTFTLGSLNYGTSSSSLSESSTTQSGSNFRLAVPQLALVFTSQPIASRWTQINFGLGVSQTNRFEENIVFGGDTPGSISDAFLESANSFYDGISPAKSLGELSNFFEGLAFDAGVLIPSDGTEFPNQYFTDYDDFGRVSETDPGTSLTKNGQVRRRGHAASFDLSLSGNYQEKLLIGATLGIVSSSYEDISRYVETDPTDQVQNFISLSYRQTQTVEGSGVLGRVGVIYRASQAFRIGVAYHSPTVTFITDNYSAGVGYDYIVDNQSFSNSQNTPEADVLEYRIITPSQYRASAAGIIGQKGFISAEVGYQNFAGGRVRYDDELGFQDVEITLDSLANERFQGALMARLGGELNLKPVKIRAGVEYAGAPIQGEAAALSMSGGIGYRKNRLSLDAGYRITLRPDRVYRPYTILSGVGFPQPEVTYTPMIGTAALTFGWKLTRKY